MTDIEALTRAEDDRERAASWWEAAKHWCRNKRHSDWFALQWQTAAIEQYARADVAEAKLVDVENSLRRALDWGRTSDREGLEEIREIVKREAAR